MKIKKGIDIHFEIKNTMDYDKSQLLQNEEYITVNNIKKMMLRLKYPISVEDLFRELELNK